MCPFLEEIVMVYCRAYPIRKLIPRDRITTGSPCMVNGYMGCPFFKEIMARLESASGSSPEATGKEARREVA